MLKATNLGHAFETPLFEGVDFSLSSQESVAILGVSGSGKSTLLHILSSFLKPQSGELFFRDKNVYLLSNEEILALRREVFGIIFQNHYLFRGFTGLENLHVAHLLAKTSLEHEMLNTLGIADVVHQNIATLSGGQQQRLSIARVLAKKPQILFADEPTGNLDRQTAGSVMDALHSYIQTQNGAMVIVTHDEKVARHCTRSLRLENGLLLPQIWS